VTFSVPEQDLPAIRRRMRDTTLTVQAQPPVAPAHSNDTSVLPVGELTFIDNAVDATTGRIKLKATFQNGDSALWPGQFVQTLLTLDTLHQATVVPTQAVQASQTGDYVFIVKPDSTVEKRTVVAGISRDNVTVLESGVKSGDTVVTDGHLRLTTGAKVTTQPVGQQSSLNADSQKTP
jgi:multidrug efflux system membrane fusion protein